MALSVRLDAETEKLLTRIARREGVSRSEVVRRGIRLVAEEQAGAEEVNPYEELKHLIGHAHGGPANLSERTGLRYRALLEKRSKP